MKMIDKIKSMLESNEKILADLIVERRGLLKSASARIFLTNKRVIYWGGLFKSFKSIGLSDISSLSYIPKALHNAGLIHVILKNGRTKLISDSYIGQMEANDFIQKVKKRLKD